MNARAIIARPPDSVSIGSLRDQAFRRLKYANTLGGENPSQTGYELQLDAARVLSALGVSPQLVVAVVDHKSFTLDAYYELIAQATIADLVSVINERTLYV